MNTGKTPIRTFPRTKRETPEGAVGQTAHTARARRTYSLFRTLSALLLSAAVALALGGCGKGDSKDAGTKVPAATPAPHAGANGGGQVVTLALVPSADLLPLYYAERAGCFRKLGAVVRIETYRSQLDCDTALLGGRTDGGSADITRMEQCHKRAFAAFAPVWMSEAAWCPAVCGTLRVKNTAALKGRMVAISRQSADNAALSRALSQAKMKAESVYRPQINDLALRARMLDNGQVDAAMLRWPYTSAAVSAGHRLLPPAPSSGTTDALVLRTERLRKDGGKRLPALLRRGYNMAVDSLRHPRREVLLEVLCRDYGLAPEVADTIKLPSLRKK